MKKLTKQEWCYLSIIAVALFIGMIVGWAVCSIWNSRKEPITIENPINEALKKGYDSLSGVVAVKEAQLAESEKENRITDSILINNNRIIKKDYGKLKEMDDSTLNSYLKSRFGAR
jgi:hypothetical protein